MKNNQIPQEAQWLALWWLLDDDQAFDEELKVLDQKEPAIAQALCCVLQGLAGKEQDHKQRTREFLVEHPGYRAWLSASIDKSLLVTQALREHTVLDDRLSELMSAVVDKPSSPRFLATLRHNLTSSAATLKSAVPFESIRSLEEALAKRLIGFNAEQLKSLETSIQELAAFKQDKSKLKKLIADAYFYTKDYKSSGKLYSELLAQSPEQEALALLTAKSYRNDGQLEQALEVLDKAIEQLGRQPGLLHLMAVYQRDNQSFDSAIFLVKELLSDHARFVNKLGVAQFCADLLRKNAEYKRAYALLLDAIKIQESKNLPVNLTAKAMLSELKENAQTGRTDFFEVTSTFYDTIYAASEKYAARSEESVYAPVWNAVCDILWKNKIKKVIDIGCGPGQFAEYINKKLPDIEYLGLDFSETAINLAKERCPTLNFRCEDVRNYVEHEKLDKVAYLLLEVLEHIEDDKDLLKLLPGNANVIFSVPNFDSFGHVRFFSERTEIINRFAPYFNDLKVMKINLSTTSKIYIGNDYRSP